MTRGELERRVREDGRAAAQRRVREDGRAAAQRRVREDGRAAAQRRAREEGDGDQLETGGSGFPALPIDDTVAPVTDRCGPEAARHRLRTFLEDRLSRYGSSRNEPEAEATSDEVAAGYREGFGQALIRSP